MVKGNFRTFSLWKAFFFHDYTTDESLTIDVGCGSGQYAPWVRGTYVGIDLLKRNFPHVIADAHKLPIRDSCCQLLTVFDVIEHLHDDDLFLKEAFRMLEDGGKMVISTPNYWSIDARKDRSHLRVYSYNILCKKLTINEFKVSDVSIYGISRVFSEIPRSFLGKIGKNRENLLSEPVSTLESIYAVIGRSLERLILSSRSLASFLGLHRMSPTLVLVCEKHEGEKCMEP